MKRIGLMGLMGLMIAILAGCSAIGPNPGPPTKMESLLFNTVTNYVTQTNTVQQTVPVYSTNYVTQTVTNLVPGQPAMVTNTVVQVVSVDHYLTNTVMVVSNTPVYTETLKRDVASGVQAAGAVLNMFVPGVGGLASTGLVALLGGLAYLRSSKQAQVQGTTSSTMAQEMEAVLEFMGNLPNGTALVAGVKNFLQAHQAETGVAANVLQILDQDVSNPDAKIAAQQIQQFLAQLQIVSAPPLTPPTTQTATAKV